MSSIEAANRSIGLFFIILFQILFQIQVREIGPELRHLDRNVGALLLQSLNPFDLIIVLEPDSSRRCLGELALLMLLGELRGLGIELGSEVLDVPVAEEDRQAETEDQKRDQDPLPGDVLGRLERGADADLGKQSFDHLSSPPVPGGSRSSAPEVSVWSGQSSPEMAGRPCRRLELSSQVAPKM